MSSMNVRRGPRFAGSQDFRFPASHATQTGHTARALGVGREREKSTHCRRARSGLAGCTRSGRDRPFLPPPPSTCVQRQLQMPACCLTKECYPFCFLSLRRVGSIKRDKVGHSTVGHTMSTLSQGSYSRRSTRTLDLRIKRTRPV